MKKRSFLLIPLLSMVCIAQSIAQSNLPAQARSPGLVPAVAATSMDDEMIQNFIDEMKATIVAIEDAIRGTRADSAQTMARKIFNDAKTKLGIDPEFKIQTAIPIALNLQMTDFDSMNPEDQRTVTEGVKSFRGGMILETIKLYKKACLLYARASYLKYLPKGPKQMLRDEDRSKIIEDLAKATLIPLIIVGTNNTKMTIFESDVIDSDATYEFNRDISMFLEKSDSLKLTPDNFKAYQNTIIAHLKARGKPRGGETKRSEVSNESIYTSLDFQACYKFSVPKGNESPYNAETASRGCFEFLRSGFSKFLSPAFKSCHSSYVPENNKSAYVTEEAVKNCVKNLQ